MTSLVLFFINAWVIFSLTFYYVGPARWEGTESPLVAVIVLISMLAFTFGTLIGKEWSVNTILFKLRLKKPALIYGLLIFHVVSYAILIQALTGRNIFLPSEYSFDFGNVYTEFHKGLIDSSSRETKLYQITNLTRALLAPLIWILLIQSIVQNRIKLIVIIMFPYFASSFMRSTDKEIFDMLILFIVVFLLQKRLGKSFFKFFAAGLCATVLFLERKIARFGGSLPDCMPTLPICTNREDLVSTNFPESINYLYMLLASYITQGYEGMHYALQQEFNPQFGLGTFKPIGRAFCRLLSSGCEPAHFEAQTTVNNGWDMSYHWSTAFTAVANDVHWIGLPFIFAAIGIILGFTIKSWLVHRDILSMICLALFGIFFFYISLNMQLAVTLEWSVVTIFFFGLQIFRFLVAYRP